MYSNHTLCFLAGVCWHEGASHLCWAYARLGHVRTFLSADTSGFQQVHSLRGSMRYCVMCRSFSKAAWLEIIA